VNAKAALPVFFTLKEVCRLRGRRGCVWCRGARSKSVSECAKSGGRAESVSRRRCRRKRPRRDQVARQQREEIRPTELRDQADLPTRSGEARRTGRLRA
jgi:hypothetical protein